MPLGKEPEVLVVDLAAVAGDGGRVRVTRAAWRAAEPPSSGRAVVLCDDGLSKPGVTAAVEPSGDLWVDVAGDRVRHIGRLDRWPEQRG